MSNAMNNSCWLDISHSSFWIAACITTSFTCPVTSWHQHNPRSRKGTAAKLDLQQSRGSNKQVIKEKQSACHANEGDQWILCTAGNALWTADQHSYSSDYLLRFLPTRESYTDITQGTVFIWVSAKNCSIRFCACGLSWSFLTHLFASLLSGACSIRGGFLVICPGVMNQCTWNVLLRRRKNPLQSMHMLTFFLLLRAKRDASC